MKAHQNVIINGVDVGDKAVRKESKFCNEGKWDNFVKPLLPESHIEDSTFMELGSNAGMFLKMASDKGYRKVIGIEKSRSTHKVAEKYRGSNDYTLLNETINEDFDFNRLPAIDVTLMANFHYHLVLPNFISLIDRLQYKTCYCLVVTVDAKPKAHWLPGLRLSELKVYFKNWREVGAVHYVSPEGDPHPRAMQSILFESELKRKPLDDLWNPKNKGSVSGHRVPHESIATLCRQIMESESIEDIRASLYYKRILRARCKEWPREKINAFVQRKIDLMYDIKKHGFKRPILIRSDNRLLEGGHRRIIAREMGYNSLITRTV